MCKLILLYLFLLLTGDPILYYFIKLYLFLYLSMIQLYTTVYSHLKLSVIIDTGRTQPCQIASVGYTNLSPYIGLALGLSPLQHLIVWVCADFTHCKHDLNPWLTLQTSWLHDQPMTYPFTLQFTHYKQPSNAVDRYGTINMYNDIDLAHNCRLPWC